MSAVWKESMLMGIYGDVGSGKTALEVRIAKFSNPNIPIRTNFDLKLKNASSIEPYELLTLEDGTLVCIDEFYTWAESRISPSKLNRFISYFLAFQQRKRRLDIVHTSQLRSSIDVRFRLMEKYTILGKSRDLPTSDFKFKITNGKQIKNFTISYNEMSKVFPLYETQEIVMPLDIKELSADMLFFNPQKLNIEIDRIVNILKKQDIPSNAKINHTLVKDLMLRIGEPFTLEPYVYVRLKTLMENN